MVRAVDKADAMLTLSSALQNRELAINHLQKRFNSVRFSELLKLCSDELKSTSAGRLFQARTIL